jgi:hypothetical protein
MALRLRSWLVPALSLWSLSCSTDPFGTDEGDAGDAPTIHDAALTRTDASAVPDASLDAQGVVPPDAREPADIAERDGPVDAPVDTVPAPPDLAADRAPDLAVDRAPDGKPPTNLPVGEACGAAGQCKSGFCVDGVCCDKACTDGCQACGMARTGTKDGTCAAAREKELQPCGRACGTDDAGKSAVIEKVCSAGQCIVPLVRKVVESCFDASNGCMFCDNGSGRCIKDVCSAGSCCCLSMNGARACVTTASCKGDRVCRP